MVAHMVLPYLLGCTPPNFFQSILPAVIKLGKLTGEVIDGDTPVLCHLAVRA